MKIFLTGATGHVGTHLIPALLDKNFYLNVFVLPTENLAPLLAIQKKKQNLTITQGDILDREAVFKQIETSDLVIHLAGIIYTASNTKKINQMMNVNINGTINVVDASVLFKKKLVYLSSILAIQYSSQSLAIHKITDICTPDTLTGSYAKSKAIATLYINNAVLQNKLQAVTLLPTSIVGPHFGTSIIGNIIQFSSKSIFSYHPFGTFNWVNVIDVVRAITLAINFNHSSYYSPYYVIFGHDANVSTLLSYARAYNKKFRLPLGSISFFTLKFLAHLCGFFSKFFNSDIINFINIDSINTLYYYKPINSSLIQKSILELGYFPICSLEQSIHDTIKPT